MMETKTPLLDVAIATCRPEGIRRVAAMNLPRVEGVRYIVSWQEPGEEPIPASLASRDDVEIHTLPGLGISRNRNNAIRYCNAEIVLSSDDDLTYTPEGLQAVIRAFRKRPDMDVAEFRFYGNREWPANECRLGRRYPKGLSIITFCQACRLDRIGDLRYDENFGPGSPIWHAGEDEKFMYDARKRGLHCRYIPEYICSHEHPSTGDRLATPGVAAAQGRMILLEYPWTAILRIPLKAWRESRKGGNFFSHLFHLVRGALGIPIIHH